MKFSDTTLLPRKLKPLRLHALIGSEPAWTDALWPMLSGTASSALSTTQIVLMAMRSLPEDG